MFDLASSLVFEAYNLCFGTLLLVTYRMVSFSTARTDFRVQCFARCSLESSVRNASGDATHSMSVAEHKPGRSLFKRDVLSSPKSDDMCEYVSEKLTLG